VARGNEVFAPSDVAEGFAALADQVDRRAPDATLLAAMQAVARSCARRAAQERSPERKRLLTDVQTALQTWQEVWPRLGRQPEFRLAVAREARGWATRFS